KEYLAGIVVAAHGLVGVGLERSQHDDVPVQSQSLRGRVPNKSIHAIPERRRFGQIRAINAGAALGPVEIDSMTLSEIRLQSNAEQAALGSGVDGQVESRANNG